MKKDVDFSWLIGSLLRILVLLCCVLYITHSNYSKLQKEVYGKRESYINLLEEENQRLYIENDSLYLELRNKNW